jgi:hypothetical protein
MKKDLLAKRMHLSVILLVYVFLAGCMQTVDKSGMIKEALQDMENDLLALGEPQLVNDTLIFGSTKMNGNYEIVDAIKARYECTATLFMKKGDGFVRISTNIMKDGTRAVGTLLDSKGPVIKAIQKGEAFYGNVDILGSQYETGYEPIKNAAGEIIGIYYAGFKKQ